MGNSNISKIQTGLTALGHEPGPIDGIFGKLTRRAAEAWLAVDGRPVSAAEPSGTASGTIYQGKARYPVREIVVHASATRAGWMKTASLAEQVAEIRRWHVDDRGWRDIAYHWLIGRQGDRLPGRAETEIGAGVAGHNRGVIHICLLGGHGSSELDRFEQNFTTDQARRLRETISWISQRTPISRIAGHNEYAAKACPGFQVSDFLKGHVQ